jgi:phage terminase large subunit-like protein
MLTHPHIEKANGYARDIIAGRVPACKWVRKACERHLDDLERAKAKAWPYEFAPAKAERVCRFAELMPHVKGRWARKDPITRRASRITLEPWQCFIIACLFGWVKKRSGMRRFRRASIYIPRKNAKSTTACIIGWWMFAKDDEPGAEVYSGATSEKQAWEVFGPARQMGVLEPDLVSGVGATINARSIVRLGDNAKFEPVIGKPGDGASPHLAIVDEYHEHPDSTHYDTMKTGMGAREQPLILIISTAGDNLSGPCRDDWLDCEKLLDGVIEDDTHFAIIWTIDDGTDWTSEAALAMANPNWGVSVNPDIILPDQRAAIRDVTKQATFKTKHLNVWVSAKGGWLNMEKWKSCGDPDLKIEDFAGCECWVGLDAASKIDMTSLVVVFRRGDDGYAAFARHYIPEETVALPQNAHYRKWRDAGHLVETPGARVDFTVIEDDLKAWSAQFNIQQLAFDPKELNDFVNRVGLWASFTRVEVPQGPQLMSEPMKEMEALVASGKLHHACDPVLTWMASNVIRKEARGGGPVKYYYPTKARAENKIDGVVALIMALSRAMLANSGPTPGIAFV